MDVATIAVVGGSGFVGGAAADAFERHGHIVTKVVAPRLEVAFDTDPVVAARAWVEGEPEQFAVLLEALVGQTTVVNAAGEASPTSSATAGLWGANAVLPTVVGLAAQLAGASVLMHISSAAVQGSQPELDEQPFVRAHSPYARSKGAGELALSRLSSTDSVPRIVVYRPTSVLGLSRPIARRLAGVLTSRWFVAPPEDVPLPVAHIDHVGEAIVFLACHPDPPPIALHPWEEMTVRSLATAFGRELIHTCPRVVSRPLLSVVALLARGGPLAGQARRVELLWSGQAQRSSLPEMGFRLPDTAGAYVELGRQLRAA